MSEEHKRNLKKVMNSEKVRNALSEANKGKLKGMHWRVENGKRVWY